MNQFKIGVLGCANVAKKHIIPAIQSIDELKLVAVASRTSEKADLFASIFNCEPIIGYDKLLNRKDIDIIYIPLPTGLHYKWIKKALQKNKHVIAEKSLTSNFTLTKEIVSIAKKKKLLLMEDFMFQYHSQHQFVFNLIKNKEIGKIRIFRASFGFPPLHNDNFRYNPELGGGSLLDAGAYTVKATQLFLGKNIKVKSAHLSYNTSKGVDIYGGAFLVNDLDQISEIAFGFDNFYQCNYEIWGSTGKIIVEKAYTPSPSLKTKIIIEKQGVKKEIILPADNQFVNILKNLINSIKKGTFESYYKEVLNQSRILKDINKLSKQRK